MIIFMNNQPEYQPSLKSRAIKASLWTMSGFAVSQLVRLISNLIITRLLVPEMFGVMALSQVFLYIIALISDIGINSSIVKSDRGDDVRFLNTAWTLQILRGAILTIAIMLVAMGIRVADGADIFNIGSAYSAPELPLVLAALSVSTLIVGFNSTNIVLANRKLWLGKLTVLELISQIFGIVVMITWALIDKSIWALVAGSLSTSMMFMIFSHTAFPGTRNRLAWDNSAFWEIFHFGKWLLLSSIITAGLVQGDRLIFGQLLSAEMLGVYSIAYFLASSIKQAIFKINSVVFFPLLSELKRDNFNLIGSTYYKIRLNSDALAISAAGFLFASGEVIITFLYDDRYSEAGWMLSILSLSLLFTGPIVSGALYFSMDKPKYVSSMVAIEAIVLLTGLPTLFYLGGIEFSLWILAFYSLSILPLDLYYKKKLEILQLYREFIMMPIFVLGYLLGYLFNFLIASIV